MNRKYTALVGVVVLVALGGFSNCISGVLEKEKTPELQKTEGAVPTDIVPGQVESGPRAAGNPLRNLDPNSITRGRGPVRDDGRFSTTGNVVPYPDWEHPAVPAVDPAIKSEVQKYLSQAVSNLLYEDREYVLASAV